MPSDRESKSTLPVPRNRSTPRCFTSCCGSISLTASDMASRRDRGYECRFPRHTATIGRAFADMERSNIDQHDSATPFSQAAQPAAEEPPHPSAEPLPEKIGRYKVLELIGAGGFGSVYLAHDGQLDRKVAIKVPHHRSGADPDDVRGALR